MCVCVMCVSRAHMNESIKSMYFGMHMYTMYILHTHTQSTKYFLASPLIEKP